MIKLIGNAPVSTEYQMSTSDEFFQQFLYWFARQKEYQLDIETDVTPWWCDKKLITIQFGDLWDTEQWVLQWSALSWHQQVKVQELLEDGTKTKLIHNATFEYVVLRFHNIILENVYDTMNVEKVLLGGFQPKKTEPSVYKLADLSLKYLNKEMDKTEQTTFGDDILTEAKVIYAAGDVKPLGFIRRMQIDQLKDERLEAVAALENETVLAYADSTFNGMELDVDDWLANLALVGPLLKDSHDACAAHLRNEPRLLVKATELGYISSKDQVLVNWNSPTQKKKLLELVLPGIGGSSKVILNKWLKNNVPGDIDSSIELYTIVSEIVHEGDYSGLQDKLLAEHKEVLIEDGLMIPADTVTINWNSQAQVLPLLKVLNPKIKGMDKESFDKFGNHKLFEDIKEYKANLKLDSSYGQAFIDQFVEPDGRVRTNYNQVLTTGRTSSFKPNMQNIPAKESVGNRYRNAFKAPPGWVFVDSDYNSQELVVIAFLSGDPVWTEALKKGQDLHSVCAELVYGRKWKESAETTCQFYHAHTDDSGKYFAANSKLKCSCKMHKRMRNAVKSINFGLAYGMTKYKLASQMGITTAEAEQLILDYFAAFPKIGAVLNYLGRFGVMNGYIQSIPPFNRKRYWPQWSKVPQWMIDAHVSGSQTDTFLGEIERASKNMPIQGTSADIAKLSMVLIRWFIRDNNLWDKIQIVAQVHDQDTTVADGSIAEKWKPKLTRLMEEAAYFVIPNGLLTSETNITDRWSK